VVQRTLAELGRSSDVLLWNASVLFPPDNRDPRRIEVEACAPVLERICRGRTVVAVGRHAERATGAPYLRHPSHGGAGRFAEGLRLLLG
jgi:uracil-DNA glycosylase family 4